MLNGFFTSLENVICSVKLFCFFNYTLLSNKEKMLVKEKTAQCTDSINLLKLFIYVAYTLSYLLYTILFCMIQI